MFQFVYLSKTVKPLLTDTSIVHARDTSLLWKVRQVRKRQNVIYIEYFMESVCVRYLRASWSSIRNQTSEISDTNQRVGKYCTHTLSMVYYVYYIHTEI